MSDLSFLRTAGVIETLRYLAKYYPNGRRKIEIRSDLGLNPSTAVKAQRMLMEAGLLIGVSFTNANVLKLTKEGKSVADSLDKIEKSYCEASEKEEVKKNYMVWEMRKDAYKPNKEKKDLDNASTQIHASKKGKSKK